MITRKQRNALSVLVSLVVLLLATAALAHKPRFPDGGERIEVEAPEVSQAFYLKFGAGEEHTFVLPPLARAVPLQLLVLDDELGRSLELRASLRCGNAEWSLRRVDEPFYESFSRLHHRYRVIDAAGPTDEPCEVRVREANGRAGPYVFAVGDEERFSVGEMLGLLDLAGRLRAWQRGPW